MRNFIFITGGEKSGKSRYAVELAKKFGTNRIFIATATAFDSEMKKRIENHKKERKQAFETIEEPIKLGNALKNIKNTDICVIDCLTVWTNNLIYFDKTNEIDRLLDAINTIKFNIIFVSNEVGMGIVPNNELSRRFIETLGFINRRIAEISNEVIFMISGIPLYVKGG